jgi:hypothetical protein
MTQNSILEAKWEKMHSRILHLMTSLQHKVLLYLIPLQRYPKLEPIWSPQQYLQKSSKTTSFLVSQIDQQIVATSMSKKDLKKLSFLRYQYQISCGHLREV